MKINRVGIFSDVFEFVPKIYDDHRGFFYESFVLKKIQEITNTDIEFVQDNHSLSKKNVLRGMHFQVTPWAQAKLLRCISGSILEVLVNIDKNSINFLKYEKILLSSKKKNIIFIPTNYAHGFLALENDTEVLYKCDKYYNPDKQITLKWNDEKINIKWNVDKQDVILSERDKDAVSFEQYFEKYD